MALQPSQLPDRPAVVLPPAPEDLPSSTLYHPGLGPARLCACGKTIFRLPTGTLLSTEPPGEDDRVLCTAPANASTKRHHSIEMADAS